jgi:hypothetical protein
MSQDSHEPTTTAVEAAAAPPSAADPTPAPTQTAAEVAQ